MMEKLKIKKIFSGCLIPCGNKLLDQMFIAIDLLFAEVVKISEVIHTRDV